MFDVLVDDGLSFMSQDIFMEISASFEKITDFMT
jgi:hypothetical protein